MTDFITTYDSEKLTSANEANYQSYVRTYATVKENHFLENNKTMLSISNIDGISMINNCVAKTLMTENDVLATLQQYQKAGKPVLWTIFPSKKPENINAIFKSKRVMHLERNIMMHLDLTSLNENRQKRKSVYIKEINNITSLKHWTKLNAICFSLTPDIQRFITGKNADLFLNKKITARHFIAYYEDKPVGTSSVFMANGVAGIYNVTTAPEARGKGIGEAVTRAALVYGKKAGYSFAVLQATKMGVPVYKKIGFESNKHMDFYYKLYGRSRVIIPLNYLFLSLGNIARKFLRRL